MSCQANRSLVGVVLCGDQVLGIKLRKKAEVPVVDDSATTRSTSDKLTPGLDLFEKAKEEWNSVLGREVALRKRSDKIATYALGMAGVCIFGMIYFGSQNHFIPYVVMVDRLGDKISVGRGQEKLLTDNLVVRSEVAAFVKNARVVYADSNAQTDSIKYLFARLHSTADASTFLIEYFKATPPLLRAQKELVTVEIKNALPISAKVWRVEWVERTTPRGGGGKYTEEEWQATVTVSHADANNEIEALQNPSGFFVDNISWGKRL